jgi:anti-sigma B factor antagonist
MKQIARIVAETREGIPVARIEGEVDMSNAGSLGDRLRGLLTNRSDGLVVDLGPTTYLDSSGITLLFALAEELRRRQQELHVVVPEASPLRRVITIAGLDQAVPLHGSLDAAVLQAAA